jgi:hypothetical protein
MLLCKRIKLHEKYKFKTQGLWCRVEEGYQLDQQERYSVAGYIPLVVVVVEGILLVVVVGTLLVVVEGYMPVVGRHDLAASSGSLLSNDC